MISIIIPTLNEEKILKKTLSALKELFITEYEIIVSDGDSNDRTLEIAKTHAHQVITHTLPARQTIAQGRNAGAATAKGDYLVFIDADVFIPDINNFFSVALELFEVNTKLVALTVFLKVLPEHVTLSDKLFFSVVNRSYQFLNNVLHIGAASGEFQMIRTATFKKVNGYNPSLVAGEDNDMFARLSKVGQTKIEVDLHVMHTSRRAHAIGWNKLLSLWIMNLAYGKILKRSFSKEWKVIR